MILDITYTLSPQHSRGTKIRNLGHHSTKPLPPAPPLFTSLSDSHGYSSQVAFSLHLLSHAAQCALMENTNDWQQVFSWTQQTVPDPEHRWLVLGCDIQPAQGPKQEGLKTLLPWLFIPKHHTSSLSGGSQNILLVTDIQNKTKLNRLPGKTEK